MLYPLKAAAMRAVSLERAKAHLRVDQSTEDDLIGLYLDAAIDAAADYTQRAVNQTQYRQTFDRWHHPHHGRFELVIAPVVSVIGVSYRDTAGKEQDVDPLQWFFAPTPSGGDVIFASTFTPPALWGRPGDVFVDLEAGYDPPGQSDSSRPELALPSQIAAAVLLIVGHLYANREAVIVGRTAVEIPLGAIHLLNQLRIYR